MLLTTSAIREYRRRHPETKIIYRTYTPGRRRLSYAHGAPSQMLQYNPDIDLVIDDADSYQAEEPSARITFSYAWFGGPSLDYPIQAHYWENLDMRPEPGQRFDSVYVVTEAERLQARRLMGNGPSVVLTLGGGWPGKNWTTEGWIAVTRWAVENGIRPIITSGERVDHPGFFGRGIVNLSGTMDIRALGAVMAEADYAVCTEGGPSNMRFALGKPAVLLTCATQADVQVWTPPELTTEIRSWKPVTDLDHEDATYFGVREFGDERPACEPCMWRREHVLHQRADVPPANIAKCPQGISLRDLPADVVIAELASQLAQSKGAPV